MTNEVYPQNKLSTNKAEWSEDKDVFPLVRKWLRGLGYMWREQVWVGDKRADIVAKHPQTGEEMIVEVKGRYQNNSNVIDQIHGYAVRYGNPDATLVIALPVECAGYKLRLACAELGIQLVMLEMTQPVAVEAPAPVDELPASKGLLTNEERMEIMEQLAKHRPDLFRLYSGFLSTLLAHQSQSQESES